MIPKKMRWIWLLALVGAPALALAKVSGTCVTCHTMHNSQAGIAMAFTYDLTVDGKITSSTSASVANKGLLTTDCVGCHQGNNSSKIGPFVLDVGSEPIYGDTGTETGSNTLAGGNFYWVMANDRAGHNVVGIKGVDGGHGTKPPGGTDPSFQLTCAGTYGCHGSQAQADPTVSLLGSHHKNDMTAWNDGLSVATSYRFLDGVQGLEDGDYELQPASDRHNRYYGQDRGSEDDSPGTMSSHCGRCHGNFHNGNGQISAGTNVWLRHPTDFDMSRAGSSSEYEGYNGGTGTNNPYSVIAPVARASSSTTANAFVYGQTDDAIVMCLSCHRAHGTPHDGILRWDYKNWPGTGFNGCAICHTAKD